MNEPEDMDHYDCGDVFAEVADVEPDAEPVEPYNPAAWLAA